MLHLLVIGGVVGQRPQEGIGILVGENRMQLAVDGAALLVIERQLASTIRQSTSGLE